MLSFNQSSATSLIINHLNPPHYEDHLKKHTAPSLAFKEHTKWSVCLNSGIIVKQKIMTLNRGDGGGGGGEIWSGISK